MDNQRLVIWAVFGLLAWMTYQAWQQDYAPVPQPTAATAAIPASNGVSVDSASSLPELGPQDDNIAIAVDAPDLAPDPQDAADNEQAGVASIVVRTDVLTMTISTQGGTLIGADLLHYPVAKDRPEELVSLLRTDPDRLSLLQSGLRSGADAAEANHLAMFSSERSSYELGSEDNMAVSLHWADDSGIAVTKTYKFTRGSYIIGLEQTITNNSEVPWRGAEYAQQHRYLQEQERSMFDVDSYSFNGPIVYDGEKAEKLDREELQDDGPYTFTAENGWFGAIRHHFVTAVVPEPGTPQRYSVVLHDKNETSSAIGVARVVEPGASHTFKTTLFVGPKLQSQLEQIDKKLKLTVDYGLLTAISQPLFWLLSLAYGVVSNWGVSIILVTILIKLVFYKLTESSGRSMA
ncbi:MAG: membrane protein insertase YidC, partial [Gammaproteobacteria bacterium]|nr:membrane protein insertase YidC [Gammaproteobacteria bacterium]